MPFALFLCTKTRADLGRAQMLQICYETNIALFRDFVNTPHFFEDFAGNLYPVRHF